MIRGAGGVYRFSEGGATPELFIPHDSGQWRPGSKTHIHSTLLGEFLRNKSADYLHITLISVILDR